MRVAPLLVLLLLTLALPGCEVIGAIFRAGMWVGVIGVLLVVGLVAFVVSRLRRP